MKNKGQNEWIPVTRRGRSHAVYMIDLIAEQYRNAAVSGERAEALPRSYRQLDDGTDNYRAFRQSYLDAYVNALRTRESRRPGFLHESARQYVIDLRRGRAIADHLATQNYGAASSWADLRRGIGLFEDAFFAFIIRTYHYIIINRFYPDELLGRLAKRLPNPKRQAEAAAVLFAASKPTGLRQHQREMLSLARTIRQRRLRLTDAQVTKRLETLAKQHGYLGMYVMWGAPFTPSILRKRLAGLLRQDLRAKWSALQQQDRLVRRSAALFRRLKLTHAERVMVRTVRAWAYAGSEADETFGYVTWRALPLLHECSRRLRISYDELLSMRRAELRRALRNGKPIESTFRKRLAARERAHALVYERGRITLYEGLAFRRYAAKERQTEAAVQTVHELQGQPTSPGFVRGRVTVVRGINDIHRVRRGDVLVAVSTVPAFVPAMERAAAIVTDEGGLLSHAAIVSRELNVPCVVGTKIGTSALKDGDRVEVDAVRGIVRRLNHPRQGRPGYGRKAK